MQTLEEPQFLEPLSSEFVYAAWTVDPVRVGPFVRSSATRRRKLEDVRELAGALAQRADVEAVHVFEASVMPPLPDMPRHDVVMLARARNREKAAAITDDDRLRATEPATVFLAANAARFGATENGWPDANILLNHFTGPADRPAAVEAWRRISGWYTAKLGVDNSTLLTPDESAPYVLINYVRIPGPVVGFVLAQLLRPSFHRFVRAVLKRHRLTALPLFVKTLPIVGGDA